MFIEKKKKQLAFNYAGNVNQKHTIIAGQLPTRVSKNSFINSLKNVQKK